MSGGRTGFLLVDKPGGWTSHDVVARVRSALSVKKVGHAGTLDPMATGLLVLGLGRATRLLRFVQAFPKEYVARILFGVATDSLDADGAILTREPMPVDQDVVAGAMARFVGPILQVPPMVSARRVGGHRLYELARDGVEVEREATEVTIYAFDLVEFSPCDYPEATVRVRASAGTYVRTLADDVARALGGRAHLTALRRIRNGSLDVAEAATVDQITAAAAAGTAARLVLDPADGLPDIPAAVVEDDLAAAVANGVPLAGHQLEAGDGLVKLLDRGGTLLALYRVQGARAVPEVVLS
ncbi:MAG TPA: tRNA pseudouridine(55) synthase TruB [Acidimicrobiia bacterium]